MSRTDLVNLLQRHSEMKKIAEAVNDLLKKHDGLVLGICNGFQAIIKLGLLPYGEIRPMSEDSPTLARNNIARHVSKSVYTKGCFKQVTMAYESKARRGILHTGCAWRR